MAKKKYIELNEAVKACEDYFKDVCVYDVDSYEAVNDFERILDSIPAADVTPVKHGHWIYKKRTKLISTGVARTAEEGVAYVVKKHITVKVPYCSICGERGDNALDAAPFCPDCGARMDGDADANGNDNKTPET